MENRTFTKEEATLNETISPRSIQLSRRVRELAGALRVRTEGTPFADDSLVLAREVRKLCDYAEQLHGSVETLLDKIERDGDSSPLTTAHSIAEDEKAVEIQREIHEIHPTVKDTIKALFMWRDSPEERLRDDD